MQSMQSSVVRFKGKAARLIQAGDQAKLDALAQLSKSQVENQALLSTERLEAVEKGSQAQLVEATQVLYNMAFE